MEDGPEAISEIKVYRQDREKVEIMSISMMEEDCPQCGGRTVFQEGCRFCPSCGFSECGN